MRVTRFWIAGCWTIFILAVCWTPKQLVPEGEDGTKPFAIPHLDKAVHCLLFLGFAVLWRWSGKLSAGSVVWIGGLLAIASELGQLVPVVNRDANLPDIAADMLGIGLGLLFMSIRGGLFATGRHRSSAPTPDNQEP